MWVLLQEYNDYDQHGGYFAGIFNSYEEAEKAAGGHIGRGGSEYSWFEVDRVEVGEFYEQE
jgi:hypothetical protein